MRKNISYFIILVLIISVLSSCGAGTTGGGAAKNAATQAAATTAAPATTAAAATTAAPAATTVAAAATTAADAKKKDSISVDILYDFNIMDGIDSLTDNKYVDFIEKNTGVRIVLDTPGPAGYNDKLNIVMASGAHIDAFMASRDQIMKFALDGILTDIAPYVQDSAKYPNITTYMDPNSWTPVKDKNAIYGFPYSRFDAFHQVVFVQKEWMENLKLEIPTTVDEYYEVLKAFTLNDPDKNGQNDTFGLLANDSLGNGARLFKPAFNCDEYQIIDGMVTPPQITEGYKDWLKFINKLIKEKIMDPEFPTGIVSVYMDKLKTYKYGMTSYFWHANQLPEYDQGKVHEKWLSIDLPERVDGSGPSYYAYGSLNRNYTAIPTTCKKIDALMRVYDWVCSPDEGERWLYLGVEGDEYTMDASGNIKVLKQRNSLHWMFTNISPGILNDNVKKYLALTYPGPTVERLDISTRNGRLDEIQAGLPYFPDLSNFNLGKVIDEYTVTAVLGNVNIDETWDEYVAKYKAAGGEAAMKFWTESYNEKHK